VPALVEDGCLQNAVAESHDTFLRFDAPCQRLTNQWEQAELRHELVEHERMDSLSTLQSLGLTLPSPAYIFGTIVFGLVGFAAYVRGKRAASPQTKWLGVALMFYPYAVSQTWLLFAIGAALCVGLFVAQG
jgi:hypothetical protein